MRLRLHTQARNSAGERVRIALNLKGLDYEYVPIPDLAGPEYERLNPQQLMPTLEVDGQPISQSLAILEYLEKVCPTPTIFPEDAVRRAQARAFAVGICAELHALTVKRVRKRLPSDLVSDWYAHWTSETLGALEKSVGRDQRFCFADCPTVADICLVPQMANARRFGCDLSAFARLRAIDALCRALPAFAAALPERQVDFTAERPSDTQPRR
ncbi:maleylacetoacetate isomerase [Yoonia sp. 2307UL14-13]|uniref:maleylacetoacetate isomerase n=1 Tax=Yoonia sp. 2307UL14-13 TaxID=3126506 RepID=UPI00309CFE1F